MILNQKIFADHKQVISNEYAIFRSGSINLASCVSTIFYILADDGNYYLGCNHIMNPHGTNGHKTAEELIDDLLIVMQRLSKTNKPILLIVAGGGNSNTFSEKIQAGKAYYEKTLDILHARGFSPILKEEKYINRIMFLVFKIENTKLKITYRPIKEYSYQVIIGDNEVNIYDFKTRIYV